MTRSVRLLKKREKETTTKEDKIIFSTKKFKNIDIQKKQKKKQGATKDPT